MTSLGAGPETRLTADTVIGVCNRHHLVPHVIPVLIFSFEGLFDKLKDVPAADFVAAPAANAFFDVNGFDEPRRPLGPAPCISYNCHSLLLSL